MKQIIVLLLVVTFFVSCSQRSVTTPDESEEQIARETTEGMQEGDRGDQEITPLESEGVQEEDMRLAREVPPSETYGHELRDEDIFMDVLFDYNRYDIREDEQQKLNQLADWLIQNSVTHIIIEGHCDERGTIEYNLALGDKRAKSVKDYLLSLGVPSKRVETISYGEEKPSCLEPTEDCWSKNRRAHFISLKEEGK